MPRPSARTPVAASFPSVIPCSSTSRRTNRVARDVLAEADLLIGLGSAFDGMTTANWTMPRPRAVADVNLAPSGAYDPDITVVADVKATLDALTIRIAAREPWADSPFTLRDVVRRDAAADPLTRDAIEFVQVVESAWPAGYATVCDMAVAGYWMGGYASVHQPRRLLYPVGWGTLGYGLPAAIGVAAAGIPTLAVVGDGGLAMALGELATIAEQRLPITLLVVDDDGYGMLRFDQRLANRPERGVDLTSPAWSDLGRAFSIPVDEPQTADDLRNVVAWSAMTSEPRIIVHQGSAVPPTVDVAAGGLAEPVDSVSHRAQIPSTHVAWAKIIRTLDDLQPFGDPCTRAPHDWPPPLPLPGCWLPPYR